MVRKVGAVWTTVVVVAGGLFLSMATAGAGGYPPPPQPTMVPPTLAPFVAPARVVRRRVALTGADILQWVLVAAGVIAVGAVLVVLNRRRAHAHA